MPLRPRPGPYRRYLSLRFNHYDAMRCCHNDRAFPHTPENTGKSRANIIADLLCSGQEFTTPDTTQKKALIDHALILFHYGNVITLVSKGIA